MGSSGAGMLKKVIGKIHPQYGIIRSWHAYLWLSWACQPWGSHAESPRMNLTYDFLEHASPEDPMLNHPGWILPMTFLSMPAPEDPMLNHTGWILPMTFLSMPAPEDPMLNHTGWILPMTFLSMPAPEDPMLRMNHTYNFLEHASPWGSHAEASGVEDVHRDLEPSADLPDDVLERDRRVVEEHFTR